MKRFIYILLTLVLFSCTENDKKLDRETNTYYSKYKFIYEKYDSLGIEKSIELLNEYIEEFPNAVKGYNFKAFLLAKANRYKEATETIQGFKGTDEENILVKNYLVSLLLMDTNNLTEVKEILFTQEKDTFQTLERDYNKFWLALYENQLENASKLSQNIIKRDTTSSLKIERTTYLLKAVQNDTTYIDSIKKVNKFNIFIEKLDSLARNKINLVHYYKSLSN